MGFNDFWINNNGKKEHLNNAKHGVRKDQMDTKFHNLFDAYDVNGNGTLETEELGGIFKGLTKFAGADKTLDLAENKQVASLFKHQAGINNADFMGFVQSISLASEDIVDIKETPLLDGGKEVETRYKDGSVLLISYYADGDYKFKKFDQKDSTVETIYFMNENYDQKYTKDELEKLIKKEYNNVVAQIKQRASQKSKIDAKNTVEVIPNYEMFRQQYLSEHKVEDLTVTKNSVERHELELSERGQADVAVRDFVLDHYVQTHAAAKTRYVNNNYKKYKNVRNHKSKLFNTIRFKKIWNDVCRLRC